MFTTEKFNGKKISFEYGELSLKIDIWEDAKFTFSQQLGMEAYCLWSTYQAKPIGEPTRSRADTSFGLGSDAVTPTTITAGFLSEEDMADYEKQLTEAFHKKESYADIVKMRKEAEEQLDKDKKDREEALNK